MTRIVDDWYNEVSEPDENKWCDWCGDINCKIHGPCGVCGNNNCSDHYEAIDNTDFHTECIICGRHNCANHPEMTRNYFEPNDDNEMKACTQDHKDIVNPIHHPDVPDDLEELWRVTKNFVRGGGGDSNE